MKKEGFNTLDRVLNDICAGDINGAEKLRMIIRNRFCDEIVAIDDFKAQCKYSDAMKLHAFEFLTTEYGRGNLFATAILGYFYLLQLGVKENKTNFSKGLELLQKAEKGNNPLGIYYLGWFYFSGLKEKGFEIKVDDAKAIECFERAAKLGCARALYQLGEMHKEGRGFERNAINANKYYQQAASLGDPSALSNLTHERNQLRFSPFFFYLPKNLDFTWNITYTEKGTGYETQYSAVTFNLHYTGSVDIGTFTFNKPIRAGFCYANWLVNCFINKTFGMKSNKPCQIAAMEVDKIHGNDLGNLWGYMVAKEVGDLIRDADCLIMDRIEKAKQAQTMRPQAAVMTPARPASNNYPGVMFQPTPNVPVAAPIGALPQYNQQLDPARMMAILQALQSNPMFAQQCSILLQQYENATAAQSQFQSYK